MSDNVCMPIALMHACAHASGASFLLQPAITYCAGHRHHDAVGHEGSHAKVPTQMLAAQRRGVAIRRVCAHAHVAGSQHAVRFWMDRCRAGALARRCVRPVHACRCGKLHAQTGAQRAFLRHVPERSKKSTFRKMGASVKTISYKFCNTEW